MGEPISPEFIGQRLNIPVDRVNAILDELEKKLILFRDGQEAVVWSYPVTAARTPHHFTLGSPSILKELARVVKPDGSVTILGWSSQQLLPGYPMLEARLNAIAPGYAVFFKGIKPEWHFLRALGWFHQAGFEAPTAHTFVGNVQPPLRKGLRDALLALFEMLWAGTESEATKADWGELQRLCQPDSPDFILDCPDYYAFFTYSLFHGRITK